MAKTLVASSKPKLELDTMIDQLSSTVMIQKMTTEMPKQLMQK